MKKGKLILTLALATIFFGCTNGDDYGTPDLTTECQTKTANVDILTGVVTPASLVGQNATLWTDSATGAEDILEAYVTSSDEGGNFYKSISMVAFDSNGDEYGFSVPVDQYNLYTMYEPGRKVYVKLNGLYYGESIISGNFNGVLVGGLNGTQVGRISINEFPNFLLRSCESKTEEELMHTDVSVADAQSDEYLNKLIEFNNVQFADAFVGKTYYNPSNTAGSGTNNTLVDINGNDVIVRVSAFSNFVAQTIPSGSGKVRGVMTKYNGDYQFMIRTVNDVQLTDDRFEVDLYPPLVGNSLSFVSTLNEPFSTYSNYDDEFPTYINDAAIGGKYWQVRSFSGNSYIQMSSFGGTAEENRSLFIIPVDMTAANNLSFKTKDGFNNGDVLKVYYSLDYVPGGNAADATLVDITSNFAIATGTTSGYASSFTNSGIYNIPAGVTGNGYFIFEYVGNGSSSPTTTMQIDDIVIN